MKILLCNKFFFLNGGSERVFFQERDFLVERGNNIVDFSMQDERNIFSPFSSFFVPNINYLNVKGGGNKIKQAASFIHSTVAVKSLTRLIKQEKPEIAHLHNIYHQLTPAIIPVLKKHRIKVVLTLHDYKLICPSYLALKNGTICTDCEGKHFFKPFTKNCQNSRSHGLLLALEAYWHQWRKSYNDVDCFIAPSHFLLELTSKRIPSSKIKMLRNGIDVTEYRPNYNDDGYVLYFGRLTKEKGIETLLKAHDESSNCLPLKVVGTGPAEKQLQRLFPRTEFLGFKNGKTLNDLISNAAFVVVPSEWYENCSMVVLEAMALGKPIIGSDIGGIPEQIEDGTSGFLFEMGNVRQLAQKMRILSDNPNMRSAMGKAAREKLERKYSLQSHCEDLLSIYQKL